MQSALVPLLAIAFAPGFVVTDWWKNPRFADYRCLLQTGALKLPEAAPPVSYVRSQQKPGVIPHTTTAENEMDMNVPADLRNLHDQLDAAEHEAQELVAGLAEEQATWQPEAGSWSIAECLDHLATSNRVYPRAMQEPANRARARGRHRYRPVKPGLIGQLFVRMLEPPPTW